MGIERGLKGLWLLVWLASSVGWAANALDFNVRSVSVGPPASLTLDAVVRPSPSDLGQGGGVWVGATFGTSVFVLTPSGWSLFTGGGLPPYSSGSLKETTVRVLQNTDVSALECASVLVGYGQSANDMLFSGTYAEIYQVPARRERVTGLPCSTMADADAARFLEQATFGVTAVSLAEVKQLGFRAWIDRQVALPASGYGDWPVFPSSAPASCDGTCRRDNYSTFQLQRRFYQNALTGEDQLRQRVAFALGQILVVSGVEISNAYAIAEYHNLLNNLAFGNFETILTEVTLSPAMGRYLDMVNNGKPTKSTQQANENYARELLQLFSIGLYQLNSDGTPVRDGGGRGVPAYDEATIQGFARAFTGWTFPPVPGTPSQRYNPAYYKGRMVADDSNHDTSAKPLLSGTVLPPGQGAAKDLADAIHNVFTHPNVGPFISRQLIEKLVMSNPSSGYVSRVAAVFANNGRGERGDMKAVVRAILLDPEARGGLRNDADYGHLQEPALFVTRLLRALGGTSDGVWLRSQAATMGQSVLNSPSVFNFYPPGFQVAGGLYGPEFGIQTGTTAFARANYVYQLIYGNGAGPDSSVAGAIGTRVDLQPFATLAANPAQLVDRLDVLLLHGTLSPEARSVVINAVSSLPTNDATGRARLAIYLLATASQFQVQQ